MTDDTSALVTQFALLAAIILARSFYIGGVRVSFVALGPKEKVTRTHASLRQVEIGTPEFFPCILSAAYDACGSKRVDGILGHKHCNCGLDDLCFTQSGLRTDCIFGQVRNTTVQVWTVGEGFGIGSEFFKTCCAA